MAVQFIFILMFLTLNLHYFITVCIYVNPGCNCGSLLSPNKVSQLPIQFGPGSIHRVLREAIQALVDCSHNEKSVFTLLKEGNGKVIIQGR